MGLTWYHMFTMNSNSFHHHRPNHYYNKPPPSSFFSESKLLFLQFAPSSSSSSSVVSAAAAEVVMGGRGRSRTQRKHFKQSRENVWKRSKSEVEAQQPQQGVDDDTSNNSNPTWEPLITENPAFEEYYKEQGIVAAEEWETLMDCLKMPLPAAFRINSSSQFYTDIREQLENDFAKSLQGQSVDGIELEAIKPLPWYPENLAWHSNYSRKQLRKNQTLERFHEFLKLGNEIGNITRQEAVSMVPPLFLDVQPDHFVLDMCAAPGSKTFQLLEMIHRSAEPAEPGTLPSGMVIANDVDVQRCNLLIHQTKRMCTANLIVTTNEAQQFPGCHLRRNYVNACKTGDMKEHDLKQLLFDRVLCDVPCSGDGTLRKAPDIWRKWNAGMGNGLHGLQVQIALRGLSLLKVGGKIVYSTCSMNPVENEAVVAEVLRRCGESVELVDVSAELPQLVRRPGLKKWKVRDKGMWLVSYRDVPKSRKAAVIPGMFPSGKDYGDTVKHNHDKSQLPDEAASANKNLQEEVSDLPLERCMRIAPHDQNTGAFFIAVLQKLSPLPAIQKKPVSEKLSPYNNGYSEEVANEVKEEEGAAIDAADVKEGQSQPNVVTSEVKGGAEQVDADLTDAPDAELPVVKSDADLLGSEPNESALDSEPHKISEEIEAEESQPSINEAGPEMVRGKRKLQIQGRWVGVDPVIFYRDDAVVDQIREFYGIRDSFPFTGHLVTRNSDTGSVKRIYYISKSVKDVLELNILAGQQLKIASVGIKMFERQTSKEGSLSPCAFRISSEGLPLLLAHITKQILYASPVDFKHLLQYKSIKFGDFVDADFGIKASELMLGCCVVVLNKDSSPTSVTPQVDASTIAIGCWRGRTNISVMVTALDCQELLERVSKHMETEVVSVSEQKKSSSIDMDDNGTKNDAELKEDTEAMVTAT